MRRKSLRRSVSTVGASPSLASRARMKASTGWEAPDSWGTGGFKAIPGSGWAMAELMAKGEQIGLAAEFGLNRFQEGRFIDESVAAGVAH